MIYVTVLLEQQKIHVGDYKNCIIKTEIRWTDQDHHGIDFWLAKPLKKLISWFLQRKWREIDGLQWSYYRCGKVLM